MTCAVPTAVIDPNGLLREGLRRILARTPFRVVLAATSSNDVLSNAEILQLELLLLSADYSDSTISGDIRRIKAVNPGVRIVVLCSRCDLQTVIECMQAGANGFLLKNVEHGILTRSLGLVMLGETILSSSIIELFAREASLPKPSYGSEIDPRGAGELPEKDVGNSRKFSQRESEILECLTRGEANKFIARKFDIAEATVKVHIKAILRKIRVKNRTQAAVWAHNNLLFARDAPEYGESSGALDAEASKSFASAATIR